MNWDAIGAIGEIVGAIAVVISLVYLASQIKHSQKATTGSVWENILNEWRQHHRETFLNKPENIILFRKAMTNFDALSDEEKNRANYLFLTESSLLQSMVLQADRGHITNEQLNPWLSYLSSVLRTPGGKVWWAEFSTLCDAHFSNVMNTHMETTQ
ncbi:MAG: hypothetical protein RLN96_01125, partial [Pseudomonadales bacterium]